MKYVSAEALGPDAFRALCGLTHRWTMRRLARINQPSGAGSRGVARYLGLVDDIAMVGDASDGRGALDWLARAKALGALPDVVLMDLLMKPMGGLEATGADWR